jgi:dynein assembly factor with WDR repeat domains 1
MNIIYLEISRKYRRSSQFQGYSLKKSLKVHKQPLTNCMFSKHGDKFATASFDRTCNIWDTTTGKLCSSLSGHKNAVFCLDFSRFS